jgi:hypothetical protein
VAVVLVAVGVAATAAVGGAARSVAAGAGYAPPRSLATATATATATSSLSMGTLADNNCEGGGGARPARRLNPCGTPHTEHPAASSSLIVRHLASSAKGGFGRASASATDVKTAITRGGRGLRVRSQGSLDGSARCVGRASDHVCPGGEEKAAFVYSYNDAAIGVHVAVTGLVPYILDATINATGTSLSPCAGVSVTLASGLGFAESLDANGPHAKDPGCTGSPSVTHVHNTGVIQANGMVDLEIRADTSFINPGTRRTDSLHADWNVDLIILNTCTISAADIPGYDPAVGALINGTPGDDAICGGDGPDTINGLGGHDLVWGGGGIDLIFADGTMLGGDGNDKICGGAGDDRIEGGDGRDIIWGGPGDDTIDAGAGDDKVVNISGACVDVPSPGRDVVDGGPGDDLLEGAGQHDVLRGGAGADKLRGLGGADRLEGGAGNDVLVGGAGGDTLLGGPGNDYLHADDHRLDTVDCGPGRVDRAALDAVDRVRGCEFTTVLR